MLTKLDHFLFSADPKLRRLLGYWAGTGSIYLIAFATLWFHADKSIGLSRHTDALYGMALGGVLLSFVLVRVSQAMRIAPWQLAVFQALFAMVCIVGAYGVSGAPRGAVLMIMLVVMVFCTFSLRPRATMFLCATAIGLLAAAMLWLVNYDPVQFPPAVEGMHFGLAAACLLAVTLLTGEMSKLRTSLKQQKQELLTALAKIRTLATIDELTCLANRRYMNEVLTNEERRDSSTGAPMCIALLDIDFFKNVNDQFGHDSGDQVLRTFAAAARAELRVGDVLARWGGEEFLLMLPGTEVGEALFVLKRMADRVRAIRIPGLDMERDVTFSAGLVERRGTEPFADTISRADKAMYKAKASGRNRVETD
ncbi:GGDEF domain-containing protein [Massilia sp. PAMC28688]|uniref:diguanylate cyclase n=1 Tax=Massilia sp. PAMC28688 TaxID=2861283 RepID=UPI001C62D3B1|nr:diguanylate cyclase [Massilia sp. PAMC28688]QYF93776.1 GGDEF domain-containing protein [Massilia sp. PAMC28688]